MKTNEPDEKTYVLKTIADIFSLPSTDHIERCMDEMKKIIIAAKATEELACAIADATGIPEEQAKFIWPESFEWIDDGKGELGFVCEDTEGKKLFEMAITKGKQE